jgi:hypothetical protein
MARTTKPKPMITASGGTPQGGALPSRTLRSIDKALAIQRPVVLAHLRGIRRRHPHATPQELIRILERRYLAAVTTGGAAVGVTAVVPGIGTGITLALSGVETAGFLEATALFTQSVSEVHGIAVSDPDRARALVMTMMLGREGADLVRNWAGQATGGGVARNRYWGEIITSGLPQLVVGPLADRLKSTFLKQFALRGGTSLLAKAIPFGVGAVIGGTGNHLLGRKVLQSSRLAFGTPPFVMPEALADPNEGRVYVLGSMNRGIGTVNRGIGSVNRGIRSLGASAAKPIKRLGKRGDDTDRRP